MKFEREEVPTTQFQTRSASETRSIEPLLFLEYSVVDEATSTGDEFSDFTRTIDVNIQWISRIGVEEFVEIRRDLLRENYKPSEDMDDSDNEDIENLLLEQHVSAFVSGDSGSNTLDYDGLAKNDFQDLRTKKKNLEIDWGQMFAAERTNQDRDRVKNWININRREERSRRYDTILFSQLKNSEFYPERIGNLGFGFIGAPEVAYWDGIGGLIGFTPEAEERNTGERENQMEYQEEMDKEYSHLSCNFSSYQRVEKDEDEGFRVRHDKSLGTDLSAERFGWYFERTVPDDYLARAREIHGYDSNEDVGRAVYNLVTEKLEQVAEEHDLKKEGTEDLPSFEERISEELSFDNL